LALETTAAVGQKVVRLTRNNYLERYLSMEVARVSQHWSIHNAAEKAKQMAAFVEAVSHNYTIDINWMLFQFETMASMDDETDAWVREYGGETLWVDYRQVRDDPVTAFGKITAFLGGGDHDKDDVVASARRAQQSLLDEAGSLAAFTGRAFLEQSVANAEPVKEALTANGYGALIGLTTYQPIQHVIYAADTVHPVYNRQGLNVTVIHEKKRRSQAEIDNADRTSGSQDGPGTKFRAALPTLESMSPNSIVVLSQGHEGSVNHHIRDLSTFYTELAKLRQSLANLNREYPGAVLVSASSECCSKAMQQLEPGALFHAKHGKRKARTCEGNECESNASENKADMWKRFMKERSTQLSTQSNSIYLEGSFVAGTVADMIRFIRELDMNPLEDDRAVLTDYMYRHPEKLVLDYDNRVFGQRFDGVLSKMDVTCSQKPSPENAFIQTESPLFLHHARHENCRLNNPFPQYPLWKDPAGIAISPILNHVEELIIHDKSLAEVDRHFDREIFYIMDKNGIWGTEVKRDIYRVLPTEEFLGMAHEELMALTSSASSSDSSSKRWSALQRTMRTTGFPHWAWYGDWKACAKNNMGKESIPLFTTCASTDCEVRFAGRVLRWISQLFDHLTCLNFL
jgi:hypothetical protein